MRDLKGKSALITGVAGYNEDEFGCDQWVIPYIRSVIFKDKLTPSTDKKVA